MNTSPGSHDPLPLPQAKQDVPAKDMLSVKMGPYFLIQTYKLWLERRTFSFRGTRITIADQGQPRGFYLEAEVALNCPEGEAPICALFL